MGLLRIGVFFTNLMYELLNVPDFNGIIFTRAHKLISFFGRKVNATDIHGVTFENSNAFDLIKDWCIRAVVPETALVVFRTGDDKVLKLINCNYDIGMSC